MSQFPSRKEVERIKKMYPKGTRIQIERMNDPYHPIERGTKGTVDHVDTQAHFIALLTMDALWESLPMQIFFMSLTD